MRVSASPHFGSISPWQVKPPKSIAHMFHITLGKASKNLFPPEWLTLMTDTFWFHICWNVESVTWPLWYWMIYRVLTPVENVSGGGMKRPVQQVDSVNHITFKDTTTYLPALKFPVLLHLQPLLGHCHLTTSCSLNHERASRAACQCSVFTSLLRMPSGGNKMCIIVQIVLAPVRWGLWQIQTLKESKNKALPSLHRRHCQSALHYKIRLAWGHCLVWCNYIIKLSLLLWHNGR